MKPLLIALSTLTALPVPTGKWSNKDLKASVIFYPLAGAFIGGLLAVCSKILLSADLQALIILLIWVLITMAFHLDGLGDCLDGWLGGKNPAERQRIMKDAAMGVYGTTGIVLTLLFKYVLLVHLLSQGNAWAWLLAIPVAARWAVTLSCLTASAPLGDKGLGSYVLGLSFPAFALSTGLTLPVFLILGWKWLGALTLSALISFIFSSWSKNRIGGLTGDGMGATIETIEVCLLFLACLSLS